MQLVNNGIMFLSISLRSDGAMSDADDWAISLGSRIKAQENAASEREQTVAMKRQIIAEKMPGIWQEMMTLFRAFCDAHNRNNNAPRPLSCHQMGDTFEVKPDALPNIITVAYNRTTYEIMIKTPSGAEWYFPAAVMRNNGDVDLVERSTRQVISLPGIVKKSLTDAILRGRIDY
jgi:hypothetical protein